MRKKTLLSLLSVAGVALLTGVSATIAWYEEARFLTVAQTQISLSSSKFLIGVEKEGNVQYADHLDPEDIVALSPAFFVNGELSDVSGMMTHRWSNPNIPELYSLRGKKAREEAYLQFHLHFLSDEDADLYFDIESKITPVRAGSSLTEAIRLSLACKDGYRLFRFGEDAAPVAFAGPLDIDPQDGYYDYQRNQEILYGDYEGQPRYLSSPKDDSPHHLPGVMALDPTSYVPRYEEAERFGDYRFEEGLDKKRLLRLKANKPEEVLLTLYAEGWDPHLTDEIAGEAFTLDLGFLAHFIPEKEVL